MQLYICVMSLHAVHADVQVLSLGAIKCRDIPPLLLQEAGSTSNCTALLGVHSPPCDVQPIWDCTVECGWHGSSENAQSVSHTMLQLCSLTALKSALTATWAALTQTAGAHMQHLTPAFADVRTPNKPLLLPMHDHFFTKKAKWAPGNETTQQQSGGLFHHIQPHLEHFHVDLICTCAV